MHNYIICDGDHTFIQIIFIHNQSITQKILLYFLKLSFTIHLILLKLINNNIYIKFDKVVINTLTVVFNKDIVATVSISPGVSGNYLRHMTTGSQDSDILKYNLYLPAGQAQLGDGTDGSVTFQINGTG